MKNIVLVALPMWLAACTQSSGQPPAGAADRAEVTFHVLGLMKTPSGAT